MNISIPSLLFGLGGKCVLNWALLFLQKDHLWSCFVGVFGISLAIVDTILTLIVTFIHLQADSNILGVRLTGYHVCLLVQILGYIYSALHLVIIILTSLEHILIVSQRLQHGALKMTWIFYVFVTFLLWTLAFIYVFLLSDVYPVLEDVAHFQIYHCWITSSSGILEITMLIVFWAFCCITWHGLKHLCQIINNPHVSFAVAIKSRIQSRFIFICKVCRIFLDTWAYFLLFLFLHIVLTVEMPAYLGLNCAWLCFINSLLIGVALCVAHPRFELAQGLAAVPPDSFCEWRVKFSLAADNTI